MCRSATLLLLAASLTPLWSQTAVPLDWRRVGSTLLDRSLASPAGGPVDRVWYTADGSRLFARTQAGRVWQTADFESWQPAGVIEPPPRDSLRYNAPNGAYAVAHPAQANRVYAAGEFAYRSDDGGLNWANLTEFAGASILGGALADAAVSPQDPDEIVVAGADGLWRSLDGGASWTGLNDGFANLPAERILPPAPGLQGIRIVAANTVFAWTSGERVAWRPADASVTSGERRLMEEATGAIGIPVTAVAAASDVLYAGTADGRLFFSRDRGANWNSSGTVAGAGRVERIRVDAGDANVAVAVTASTGRARILRTNTGGVFWEDLTGNLPTGAAHGAVLDRTSSAIYAATSSGVYFAYSQTGALAWTMLRPGAARDVELDVNGNQLYAAVEGDGIFAALAPHRLRDPKVVSAADGAARAAAPGSLLSVLGAYVQSARIGTRTAPVLAASDLESQIQIPFDVSGSDVQLNAATRQGNRQIGLPLLPTSPSIFVDRDGVALVMNADSGLVLDPATPARSGDRLQILVTGLGRVQPEWPTGLAAPMENAPRVVAPVIAYLERQSVEVTRATLAPGYIGMYLVEVQLPSIVNRGTAELYLEAQGQQSNRIQIYLEP